MGLWKVTFHAPVWLFLHHIPSWALVSMCTNTRGHTHMDTLLQSLSKLWIPVGTKKQRRNKCQEALDAICILDVGPGSSICLGLLLQSSACKRNGMSNKRGVVNKWWYLQPDKNSQLLEEFPVTWEACKQTRKKVTKKASKIGCQLSKNPSMYVYVQRRLQDYSSKCHYLYFWEITGDFFFLKVFCVFQISFENKQTNSFYN